MASIVQHPPTRRRTDASLANAAWESLLEAHAAMLRRFEEEDVWSPLTMREYDVLYTLSKCSRPQRLADLSSHVLLSQPGLSRLVDRLVARGLVSRQADVQDHRALALRLTDEGERIRRRVGLRHARQVARWMTTALSLEELSLLKDVTRKIAHAKE